MGSLIKAWEYGDFHQPVELSLALRETMTVPFEKSLGENEVLVKVLSAAINPIDYKLPESDWVGRALGMEKGARPGLDFCGRVVAKHSGDSDVSIGDLIFGSLTKPSKLGALGEMLIASSSEYAVLPDGVDPDQAAGMGTAAGTAWRALLPERQLIKAGSKVLINGGSGGVGTFAIQFAKILGAEVTTTCSTANVELCMQLGADRVLDYKNVDVVSELNAGGHYFDLAIDNVGFELYDHCASFLQPNGIFVQVAAGPSVHDIAILAGKKLHSIFPGGGHRAYHFVMSKATHDEYIQFGEWAAQGKLKTVIDQVFELDDAPRAYAKLKKGHTRGKIVVHVSKE